MTDVIESLDVPGMISILGSTQHSHTDVPVQLGKVVESGSHSILLDLAVSLYFPLHTHPSSKFTTQHPRLHITSL
ncbi:hypothetical protein CROQUDRAFT_102131 [Cronartium quercuum f. sp. fusiforme G11]|uniref:Uncharacterized protein n=1 Tax=Cronartium quercuum f. sp. fusiforme G11 TaxID=708437 RepID=A0A9P6T5B8_9BASI|nr:hypothetical protein CROQUDRAFT_102131 [Cronartium quercuum f. sp. fusiforme G11]